GRGDAQSSAWAASIWTLFGLSALLPMATTDPRVPLPGEICLVLGIAPFCIGAGFVTPMLVDRRAGSDPDRAGRAYAVNVIGCILGPLLAGFWLLPWLGERWSRVALSLPLFALGLVAVIAPHRLVPVAVLAHVRAPAVELVPSVPTFFSFFHADAASVVRSPLARIVVDDGRRFLERSADQYDVITIDPPPPPTAAGSSLLHSREFYAVAKRRLRSDGILQQWVPSRDPQTIASMTRALTESFPYVRAFNSVEGWGAHFLAGMTPIDLPSAAVLASRVPERARADMIEWGPGATPEAQLGRMLDHELVPSQLMAPA